MVYGLIIAAGNQTRFKSAKPKALVEIEGKCLLDINIDNLSRHCDKVYVVCSHSNKEWFANYETIVIDSGLGCGDAVYKAIATLRFSLFDKCIIQWGDSIQNNLIYTRMLSEHTDLDSVVPCIFEESPYVKLEKSGDSLNVKYSKFDGKLEPGYHDCSVFLFNAIALKNKVYEFVNKYYNIQKDRYEYENRKGEFSFLDIFNEGMTALLLDISDEGKSYSFNTISQLNGIVDLLRSNYEGKDY